jgi:hypothetical protein
MLYSITIWFYTICLKIQTVGHLPSLVRPTDRAVDYKALGSYPGVHEKLIPKTTCQQIFFDVYIGEKAKGERETYNTLKRAHGAKGERGEYSKNAVSLCLRAYPLCYVCNLSYRNMHSEMP